MSSITLEQLRDYLPAAKDYRFLNYAATAPIFKPSADVMASIVQQNLEPMSKHFEQWLAVIESARNTVARAIGGSPAEIAFTANTSMGLSIIAASVKWREGDKVIYPADEFPSNRFVWENLKGKGVCAEALETADGEDFVESLRKQNLDRVRLVSFSAVSYIDGRRADVREIVEFCHGRNILVAADGIQAVGAIPVDVHQWHCDFLACGGQKWLLGPVGSGFLYIRKDLLEELFIPLVGWASSRSAGTFDAPNLEFVQGARRLEPGLPDVASIAGLAKSIEVLSSAGWENIFQRVRDHNQRIRETLIQTGYVPLNLEDDKQSGIVTIPLDGDKEAEAVYQSLEKERIIVTQGRRLSRRQLRVSAHATTSCEDVDVFLNVMQKSRQRQRQVNKVSWGVPKSVRPVCQQIHPGAGQRAQHALVTGASRGLGEAIADGLAGRGYHLTLMGRDQPRLSSVAERLRREYNVDAEHVVLDLADRKAVEEWLASAGRNLDVDVLVNNAAMAGAELFAESDVHHLRDMFEVNYFAPVTITQRIFAGMLERGQGRILNIVTSGARCPSPLFSGYASSKGALWAWSEAMGRELLDEGITVTTFLPPHMESVLQRQLGRGALAYYQRQGNNRLAPASQVAEHALEALFNGKSLVMPLAVRLRLVWNVFMPDGITRQMRKRFNPVL
jgi:selenocysteine lyase/cysteine desulfurase/short-subunit dehydrogenase